MFPDDNFNQQAFFTVVTLGLGRVCIKESLSPSHGQLLLILQPVVFFVLIFIVWLIARFQRCAKLMELLQKRRSLIHVLWLVIVYSYLSLTFTALAFLTCVPVANRWVLSMDGSVQCFHGGHIPYGVISLLFFVFILAPPPFLCGLRCVQFLPRFKELMDEATDIYEDTHRLVRVGQSSPSSRNSYSGSIGCVCQRFRLNASCGSVPCSFAGHPLNYKVSPKTPRNVWTMHTNFRPIAHHIPQLSFLHFEFVAELEDHL